MSDQTGKCSRCGTELVKAARELGSKCPNYFNCSRFDIVTDESIIEELEKENEALKAFKKDIIGIISQSEGVMGWHLNGDLATWDEFGLEGGEG